jgi:hypothetical protein
MGSAKRDGKQIQRRLRTIPVDEVAPRVVAWEHGRLWCLVAGELTLVSPAGGRGETTWDDPLEYALFVRYVKTRPERIHSTLESAQAFVRSQKTGG